MRNERNITSSKFPLHRKWEFWIGIEWFLICICRSICFKWSKFSFVDLYLHYFLITVFYSAANITQCDNTWHYLLPDVCQYHPEKIYHHESYWDRIYCIMVSFFSIMSTTAAVADLRGGARDARPRWGPKFLHYHAVFGQKIGLHTHLGSWRPPLRKILDPPLTGEPQIF